MSKPNVLILDAGGPCGIAVIKLLKQNHLAHLIAVDINNYCAAFALADKGIVISPHTSKTFPDEIKRIMINENIDLVLPCFHYGVEALSEIADNRFVIDFKSALLCRDKYLFANKCLKEKLPCPRTGRLKDLTHLPGSVFIKPRRGVGSRDCFRVDTDTEFRSLKPYLLLKQEEFIVQELLIGQQWTADVLVLDGKYINAVTRVDLVMRGGNTVTAEVRENYALEQLTYRIHKQLGINSPFNLEAMETDNGFKIIEVNPRFGSGIIFSAMAGCDTVSYIVSKNQRYLKRPKPGIYSRYYEETEVHRIYETPQG